MDSHSAAADVEAAGNLALAGLHDPRLRPRLLLLLLDECLSLPDQDADLEPTRSPADLAYALDAVRAHGLLAERSPDPGLLDEWHAAVDAWVGRLLALIRSDREHSCWVGISFLGLTFQECCDERFAKSYSDWFEKVLKKLKAPSSTKMANMVMCAAMADLFMRLAQFSNLKDEATSFAQKVVQPSLRLLDDNGSVAEKAIDLLGLIIKLFPSSVYRHFNKVESVIAAKIMSGQCNLQQSKKLASTLAMLPCVRVSQNSSSLMIRKTLIVVNGLLNDIFLGLEEGYTSQEIMMLLMPPGSKPPPPLGGQTTYGDGHSHSTKKFRASVVPTISALIHCCSVVLTTTYPIQVNIPVHALVTLIQRVLLVDVSLHKSLFQSNTSLHQELIYSEIPTLHSAFLDLLGATIKGMRSSLLPHAGSVVMLIAEYFERAKLPAIRRKLYTIVQLLLNSMGVGMVMHLLQVVASNIFADLDDNSGSSLFFFSTDQIWTTSSSRSKSSSNSNQAPQLQSSAVVNSEPTYCRRLMAPLCVKIAALETLEVLLTIGGSFRACYWRAEMDLLLIKVARESCYKAGMYYQRPPSTEDPSVPDFQLASLKSLLASFLSCHHERPPYLVEGLELFDRGKLETGTELAKFCSHALLALDVLVNPRGLHPKYDSERVLPLERAAHCGLKPISGLDSGRSKPSGSVCKRRTTDNLGDEDSNWLLSIDDEKTDAYVKETSVEKHAAIKLSRDLVVQTDTIIADHQEIVLYRLPRPVQNVPTSIRTDVEMAVAGTKESEGSCIYSAEFDTMIKPPGSINADSAPVTLTDPRNPGDASISNEKHGDQAGIVLGDASSSKNVPGHNSPTFGAPSMFGSEWDFMDQFRDINNFCPDSAFSLDMADLDPDSD